MFLLRQPDERKLQTLLARARERELSYEPVGLARDTPPPAGFLVGEERIAIGRGDVAFARGVQALREWKQFDLGWAGVFPSAAPLVPGTDVLVVARHAGFWSVNPCRIVYQLGDAPGGATPVAGFAYGTLAGHAEAGEEIFQVSIDPSTGEVSYFIRAVSRERAWLARLGFPVARALQARFRRDSAAAMQRAAKPPTIGAW